MQLEKKTATHKIFKRNDGRYAVKTLKGQAVNAEEKIAILAAEGLVKAPEPKAEPEPEVEEVATEEEATAEETPAEEAPEEKETPAADEEEPAAEETAAEEAPAADEEKKED